MGFMAVLVSLPIPFLQNKYFVYFFIWWLLFFGAFILPTMTGIMLNSVKESRRTTANSLATLAYNLFGYLPAPFIYGAISDLYKGDTQFMGYRWAIGVILYWSISSFVTLALGLCFKVEEAK